MKLKFDGEEYPFPEDFTFREMNAAKRKTGLKAGELYQGLQDGDSDVILIFCAVAKHRANPFVAISDVFDEILDSKIEEVEILGDEDEAVAESEADPGPPADGADEADADAQASAAAA